VGYRDDHEAALRRVDALDAELRRARADDVEQAARIATLEAELAAAQQRAAEAEAQLATLQPLPTASRSVSPALAIGLALGLVVALVGGVFAIGRLHSDRDVAGPPTIGTTAAIAEAGAHAGLPEPSYLIRLHARGVDARGALHRGGALTFTFVHDAGDGDAVRWMCRDVVRTVAGWSQAPVMHQFCGADGKPPLTPRCSLAEVWARALRAGASDRNGALITLDDGGWSLETERPRFSTRAADDCVRR
jgi:hypothetical protein